MQEKIIENAREGRELPIIGVIGSTLPDDKYRKDMGITVGYELRKYVDDKGGTVFTGGVEGVGIDVYTGVLKYCVEKLTKGSANPEDKFFVLVPEYDINRINRLSDCLLDFRSNEKLTQFDVHKTYHALAYLTARGCLDVVRAGNEMAERRKYVGRVADVLVVVNGGGGTLDEALTGLQAGRHVISLSSGGIADVLNAAVLYDGRSVIGKKFNIGAILSKDELEALDLSLIHPANNTDDIINHLYRLFD